jgi:pilus assembly protein CpaF
VLPHAQYSLSGVITVTLTQPSVVLSAPDDVVVALDEALRAAVRREGIDPQRDVAAVRRLADALVREHDERSLTGVVAPVVDPSAVVADLLARVSGFGPLQPLLDDPEVEEIWINQPSRAGSCLSGVSLHMPNAVSGEEAAAKS